MSGIVIKKHEFNKKFEEISGQFEGIITEIEDGNIQRKLMTILTEFAGLHIAIMGSQDEQGGTQAGGKRKKKKRTKKKRTKNKRTKKKRTKKTRK